MNPKIILLLLNKKFYKMSKVAKPNRKFNLVEDAGEGNATRQHVNWAHIKSAVSKEYISAFREKIYRFTSATRCSGNIAVSKNSRTTTTAKFCLRVLFIRVIFFVAYGQLNSFIIRTDDKDNFAEMIHHPY